ncbi:MAG: enoyl-CoA hydratase/isomerase family protein, partial [Candidatus Eremiobacteraeota bacterium]|nr:enoyl-CoA hydratase/isomerase family protein [Candidatus Eremiobacteraeota bacterium]
MNVRTHARDGVLVVELDNPPVNAISQGVRAGLLAAVDAGERDDSIVAFVIGGRNGAFSGGADIREFGKPSADPNLPDVLARFEASSKPFVAAIDGFAFGGGFEIALACDARLGTSRTRVNLPEINLGLLPGAGGTQRLPRLIGIAEALRVILGGPPLGPERARDLGILDAIVSGDPIDPACALARELAGGRRRVSERPLEVDAGVFEAARAKAEPIERGGLAPARCIDAVEAATLLPFAQGLVRERELFLELRDSAQSRGRIHLFFAEREAAKLPGIASDASIVAPATVCVIGAGTMGGGIAMALANAGIDVRVVESERTALDRGRATIEKNYAATASKGRLTQADVDARLERLRFGTDLEAAARGADAVIEAVFEELDVKRAVFAELDRICKPGTLLATNTSTLDIDAIATATKRPEDVIGLHFFSPANVMRLLEIVRGSATSNDAILRSLALAKKIKKVGVVARTCDGFIGNRMLAGYGREANYLLEEGALPQDVDRVVGAFGFPMGPFAMFDLAGLDVGWRIRKRRLAEGRFSSVRDSEIGDRLCERGRFGQKTGSGIYRYEGAN